MEKFILRNIFDDEIVESTFRTNLTNFFNDLETTNVLSFGRFLKKNEDGVLDLNQTIHFFKSLAFAKQLFKNFISQDNQEKAYYTEDKKSIQHSPQNFFTSKVIDVKVLIADFFDLQVFKSDESPAELTQPKIRARIFIDFLNEISIETNHKVRLPKPELTAEGGLKEDAYYKGFIDPYFGANLFDDFVNMWVCVKEEETEKQAFFAGSFSQKSSVIALNPHLYIKEMYIEKNTNQNKENSQSANWMVRKVKTTNIW